MTEGIKDSANQPQLEGDLATDHIADVAAHVWMDLSSTPSSTAQAVSDGARSMMDGFALEGSGAPGKALALAKSKQHYDARPSLMLDPRHLLPTPEETVQDFARAVIQTTAQLAEEFRRGKK